MKKSTKKLTACLLTSILCAGGAFSCPVTAKAAMGTEVITPQNIAVASARSSLTKNSSTSVTCYGYTNVLSGYTAGVYVELQQDNGGWSTIASWSSRGGSTASVTKSKTVASGYNYRVKVTHSAYNSSGALIETIITYDE